MNEKLRLYSEDFDDAQYSVAPVKIKVVSDLPSQLIKGAKGDAAYDIRCSEDVVVFPNQQIVVPTGMKMAIPEGYVGLIKSRSGLSAKHGIEHGAGVIDSGFRGEVKVVLHNHGELSKILLAGSRIAQIIFLKLPDITIEYVDDLDSTERGEGGFGHTGLD